jgi:hypothetical protein
VALWDRLSHFLSTQRRAQQLRPVHGPRSRCRVRTCQSWSALMLSSTILLTSGRRAGPPMPRAAVAQPSRWNDAPVPALSHL